MTVRNQRPSSTRVANKPTTPSTPIAKATREHCQWNLIWPPIHTNSRSAARPNRWARLWLATYVPLQNPDMTHFIIISNRTKHMYVQMYIYPNNCNVEIHSITTLPIYTVLQSWIIRTQHQPQHNRKRQGKRNKPTPALIDTRLSTCDTIAALFNMWCSTFVTSFIVHSTPIQSIARSSPSVVYCGIGR